MGKLGDLADKAKELASSHPDQADEGVERAEQFIDNQTDNRWDEQTDKAADAVRHTYGGGDGER